MGQGSFSGLAQVMAEDLMVHYERIVAVQGAPTLANPAPVGTAINTVGSSVTRSNFWKLRDAAATAREMLVQAAMNRMGDQTRANYTVTDGVITHAPSRVSTRACRRETRPSGSVNTTSQPACVPNTSARDVTS